MLSTLFFRRGLFFVSSDWRVTTVLSHISIKIFGVWDFTKPTSASVVEIGQKIPVEGLSASEIPLVFGAVVNQLDCSGLGNSSSFR